MPPRRTPYAAGGTYHVFLSFSGQQSKDAAGAVARWIEELLHTAVRVFFYGPESAVVGENWLEHVYDGAEDSDAFILFLTRENLDSYWVNEELEAVERSARCKLILLILLDGLQPGDLPPHMQSRQAKPWSLALLKNLIVLLGREARIENVEAVVKARSASIDAGFVPEERTGFQKPI
jgi:hypothetical protein